MSVLSRQKLLTAARPRESTQSTETWMTMFLQTSGTQENQEIIEQQGLFYSCIDAVNGEMAHPFGEEIHFFTYPESTTFLDPEKVKPLLALTGTRLVDAEFTVAQQLILKHTDSSTSTNDGKWRVKTLLSNFHSPLWAMPSASEKEPYQEMQDRVERDSIHLENTICSFIKPSLSHSYLAW